VYSRDVTRVNTTGAPEGHSAPASGETDRSAAILAAASKVIARQGARSLSIDEVAREAGVSKSLVLYYFRSRRQLLAKAYVFADARGLQRIQAEVDRLLTAAERLKEVLSLYFEDDPDINEEWILWSELRAGAKFEPGLRATAEATFAQFSHWVEKLVSDARDEGSIDVTIDPHETALELMALIDGLGGLVTCGLISREQARTILSRTLDRQLQWVPSPAPGSSSGHEDAHALAPVVRTLLLDLSNSIQRLGDLTVSPDEETAVKQASEIAERLSRSVARAMSTGQGSNSDARA
jgi:AcrR family transcriptional regulator